MVGEADHGILDIGLKRDGRLADFDDAHDGSDLAEGDFEGADAILDVAPPDDQRRIEVGAHVGSVAGNADQKPGVVGILAELADRHVRDRPRRKCR